MRWIFRVIFGLIALVVAAGVILLLLPSDRIANVVTSRFEAATGRQMTIKGDISPTIWPTLGVTIGQVSIANADWSDGDPLVSAKTLSVGVDLAALLGGEIKVKDVALGSPRILLEKARNGQVNWEFETAVGASPTPAATGDSAGGIPEFTLDKATIRDAQVSYFDRAAGGVMVLSQADIDFAVPDFRGPLALKIKGLLNGEPLDTSITFSSLADLLEGRGRASDGSIAIGKSSATFGGTFDAATLGADLSLDATLTDLAQLFRAIGQKPPSLPEGLGDRIRIKGNLAYANGDTIFLRDGVLELAGNALTGDAKVVLASKPKITGNFQGGDLNFARFLGSGQGGSSAPKSTVSSGWSKAPIDASGLAAVDADISLGARSIDLGSLKLGATKLRATLTDRRLVFGINQLNAYGGAASGEYVLNGRGGLSTGGNLKIRNVGIQPLMKDFVGYERLIGQTDLDLKFLAVGNSVHALMNSLSGSGAVSIGEGELLGLDITGMIRNLDPNFVGEGKKTIFNRIGSTFTMDKGVLYNEDLAFIAPLLTARGRGSIGIGPRNLNYRVTPTALPGADGSGGLKVPLKITGTWDDPSFGLDMQAIIDQELAEEKAALKAKVEAEKQAAEAKAKAKIAKELKLQPQDGEDLEAAAKRKVEEKIEDEVKKGILKLLGGN